MQMAKSLSMYADKWKWKDIVYRKKIPRQRNLVPWLKQSLYLEQI